jgi:hypothetical protein
MLPKTNS